MFLAIFHSILSVHKTCVCMVPVAHCFSHYIPPGSSEWSPFSFLRLSRLYISSTMFFLNWICCFIVLLGDRFYHDTLEDLPFSSIVAVFLFASIILHVSDPCKRMLFIIALCMFISLFFVICLCHHIPISVLMSFCT